VGVRPPAFGDLVLGVRPPAFEDLVLA